MIPKPSGLIQPRHGSPGPVRRRVVLTCYRLGILILIMGLIAACNSSSPEPNSQNTEATAPDPVLSPAERVAEREQKEAGSRKIPVSIYYMHPVIPGITPVTKEIFSSNQPTDLIKQTIDHLSIPPDPNMGSSIWPADTYVREVFALDDGTVVVDFDGAFTAGLQVSTLEEYLMVSSLVNSILDSFPQYQWVAILVEGEIRETLAGHIDIENPLSLQYNMYTIIPENRAVDEIVVEDLDKDGDKKPMN